MMRLLVCVLFVGLCGLGARAQERAGVARVAVLELGPGENDTVAQGQLDWTGLHFDADMLERLVPVLKARGVTHVLFRVNSRGGAERSAYDIAELIHKEYNPRFETSAWLIESTAAASIAVFSCEQWTAHPSGIYEAMRLQARGCVPGIWPYEDDWPLTSEQWVERLAEFAPPARSNATMLDGLLHWSDLSADLDDEGNVTWRDDTEGQILVASKPDRYPALNAVQLVTLRLAVGSAGSLEEALELAAPGPREIVAMEASDWLSAQRVAVEEDRNATNDLFVRYQVAIQLFVGAGGEPTDHARAIYHDVAAETLGEIVLLVEQRPSLALFVMNMYPPQFRLWVDEQKELLRDYKR